jgi:hypothetical protein
MCQGAKNISIQMIQSATEADEIYYKQFEYGSLYLLRFNQSVKHVSLENKLQELDNTLCALSQTTSTSFVSISDQGRGKVLSFSGNDRWNHPLFRSIVKSKTKNPDGRYDLQNGVKVWAKESIHDHKHQQAPHDEEDEASLPRDADKSSSLRNKRSREDNEDETICNEPVHTTQTTSTKDDILIPFERVITSIYASVSEQLTRRNDSFENTMQTERQYFQQLIENSFNQTKEAQNKATKLEDEISKLREQLSTCERLRMTESKQMSEKIQSVTAQCQELARERQLLIEHFNFDNPWHFASDYPSIGTVSLPNIPIALTVPQEHVLISHPSGLAVSRGAHGMNFFGFCWKGPPLTHALMERRKILFAVGASTGSKHYAILKIKNGRCVAGIFKVIGNLFSKSPFEVIYTGSHHVTVYGSHTKDLSKCPIYMAIRGFDGESKTCWSYVRP